MVWWKSLLDIGGLVSGIKAGSRWRTEARKSKKTRRMALAWLKAETELIEYDWKTHPMVSAKSLREYINVYGDGEMNKTLLAFRTIAKEHKRDVLDK